MRRVVRRGVLELLPELSFIELPDMAWRRLAGSLVACDVDARAKLYAPFSLEACSVGRYTYIAENAHMFDAHVGAFCSIGANLICGWGCHPTNGVSTSPMFYSTKIQNGFTLSKVDKYVENKPIVIGNDVLVGMNVTVLDGVTIGDGAVIGAGAVVAGDIPPYAIAAGIPARVMRHRFDPETVERLLATKWWEFDLDGLADVERQFWDVEGFVESHEG